MDTLKKVCVILFAALAAMPAVAAQRCRMNGEHMGNFLYTDIPELVAKIAPTPEEALAKYHNVPDVGACGVVHTYKVGDLYADWGQSQDYSILHTWAKTSSVTYGPNRQILTCIPNVITEIQPVTWVQCENLRQPTLEITNAGDQTIFPTGVLGQQAKKVYTTIVAKVKDGGRPQVGYQLDFSVTVVQYSGGHDHDDASRPKGAVLPTRATTDVNGEAKFTFSASEVSGAHVVSVRCVLCRNPTENLNIDVKVPNLVELAPDQAQPPQYRLVGSTGAHNSNHWFSTASRDALVLVARFLHGNGWGVVGVNDGSTSWGGLFDIKGGWRPSHAEHRTGDEVDISVTQPLKLTEVQKRKSYGELCKKENVAFSVQTLWHQGDGYPEHFHMYLDGAGLTADAKGGPCCERYKGERVKKDAGGASVLDKNGAPVKESFFACEEVVAR